MVLKDLSSSLVDKKILDKTTGNNVGSKIWINYLW